jgi:hypothetical protein
MTTFTTGAYPDPCFELLDPEPDLSVKDPGLYSEYRSRSDPVPILKHQIYKIVLIFSTVKKFKYFKIKDDFT